MNRRGFLGALSAAVAGTAATALPGSPAPAAPVTRTIVQKGRHPSYLEWMLPREWTLDHVQDCCDKVHGMDRRLVVLSVEFGSEDDRARFHELTRTDPRCAASIAAEPIPVYVNERLGARGLRFEVERRHV